MIVIIVINLTYENSHNCFTIVTICRDCIVDTRRHSHDTTQTLADGCRAVSPSALALFNLYRPTLLKLS